MNSSESDVTEKQLGGQVGRTDGELGAVGETIRRRLPMGELPVLPAMALAEGA